MLTVRHMERFWNARKYAEVLDELIGPRIEALAAGELSHNPSLAAAALGLIRLNELHQSHAAVCPKLVRAIIAVQEADGGWGDVAITALCLRALALEDGHGQAIDRGMAYLAALQQPDGIWPKIPIRRMSADPLLSAFVLLQLGDDEKFRAAVNLEAARAWFERHRASLDSSARILWAHARLRGAVGVSGVRLEPIWS